MRKSLAFALFAQVISIGILLVLALQFFKQLQAFQTYSAQVEHTYQVINQLGVVKSILDNAEASSRAYVITKNRTFLAPLTIAKSSMFTALDSLRELIRGNEAEKLTCIKIEKLAYLKMVMQVENTHFLARFTQDSLDKRMDSGKIVMDNFNGHIENVKNYEIRLLEERKKSKQFYEQSLPESLRVVFVIAGLSTLVFGCWIFFELKKRFRFQGMLQQKLVELRQNNEELEQIAFAASHDLQEPLRKIRIFSDRLLSKLKETGECDNIKMAYRMNSSAERMQGMITDLVDLNNLVHSKETVTTIRLHKIVEEAELLHKKELNDNKATVDKAGLPTIKAPVDQLRILMNQLFANSLQFKPHDKLLEIKILVVKISGKEVQNLPPEIRAPYYYHVQFIDNGIGFDEAFKSKMFKPFQRLHNYDQEKDMQHKGMGLAMCKRVMLNLGGWIDASGQIGHGATIHLYFPIT